MPQDKFDKNSIGNTFFIAVSVCLVCSCLVAGAAVLLNPLQTQNKKRDILSNIIRVGGFKDRDVMLAGSIEACFESNFEVMLIDLETGDPEKGLELAREFLLSQDKIAEDADDAAVIAEYDQFKAALKVDEGYGITLDKSEDVAGLSKVERVSPVYLLKGESGEIVRYIFPIRGKGLWSILEGFISVEPDFNTISGLTYYTHGETPGLGGEVDNPNWKAQWTLRENNRGDLVGKKIFGDEGEVKIAVVKGKGTGDYAVDGLAGATITSDGVTKMLDFWFGDKGFGPFIKKQKQSPQSSASIDRSAKGESDG